MAANVTPLRPNEPPPPAPLTPERAALADAQARRAAAQERVDRVTAALQKASDRKYDTLLPAIRQAEEAVEDARAAEPRRLTAELLGEDAPPGPSVAEAEAALASAQTEYETMRRAEVELEREAAAAADWQRTAEWDLERAINAILVGAPGVAALLAEIAATQRRLASLLAAARWLYGAPRNAVTREQAAKLDLRIEYLEPDPSLLAAWRDAIARLETDPTAPLPGDAADPPPAPAAA